MQIKLSMRQRSAVELTEPHTDTHITRFCCLVQKKVDMRHQEIKVCIVPERGHTRIETRRISTQIKKPRAIL